MIVFTAFKSVNASARVLSVKQIGAEAMRRPSVSLWEICECDCHQSRA